MSHDTTILLLIRHGENEYTALHKLAGRLPEVHLNERGHAQAAGLVTLLQPQPIAAVYSSPLVRCVETATPLALAKELAVRQEAGLLEVDYGEWMGGELKELSKQPGWRDVQHWPSVFRFPGGETLREVQDRAVRTVNRLVAEHPNQLIAAFSHGDLIRTLLAHFLGVPLDLFQRIQISTASVSAVAFHHGRPSVMLMNQCAELPIFEIKRDAAPATAGEPNQEGAGI